jgi:gamma-glutamyl:cysteine ligase YbdK (ATP-grasp superfamily)
MQASDGRCGGSGRSPESYPNSTRAHYDELIDALVATKAIKDATKIYWDIRPSTKFETLEFRVTDVCTTLDEAVMVAGLTRALARICYARALDGDPLGGGAGALRRGQLAREPVRPRG